MAEKARLLEEDEYSSEDGSAEVEQSVRDEGLLKHGSWTGARRGQVQFNKLPWGIWLLEKLGVCGYRT